MTDIKPEYPKVINYMLTEGSKNIHKREGIELVEVIPGAFDINITDRVNGRLRHSLLRYNSGDDQIQIEIGNRNAYYLFDLIDLEKDLKKIRDYLMGERFLKVIAEKAVDYISWALEISNEKLYK